MISELNDNEILDFLMTSEFEDDYSPEELKYLLVKWRYFYRLLSGSSETNKVDLEFQIKKLSEKIDLLNNNITTQQVEIATRENKINELRSRKLTWKERISGKIIPNENEN
jgi:hypothetical protein